MTHRYPQTDQQGTGEDVIHDDDGKPRQPLERLFDIVDPGEAPAPAAPSPEGASQAPIKGSSENRGLRTAQLRRVDGQWTASLLGQPATNFPAVAAPGVDLDFVVEKSEDGHVVLVDISESQEALVVGVLQTRAPQKATIRAEELSLEGTRQVTIRSGRAALRLDANGSLELLGSHISAASRGLLRLVGRALRLN